MLMLLLPASASAADSVRLQLKWHHAFQFAGYYAAQAQGYYRAAGLDVEIVPATSGEDPRQQVVQGKAEFGVGATDLLLLREQGAPVVVLASIFQHSPQAFMVLKKQGLQSIHDLAGNTVMIEPDSAELLAYLRHEGVPIDKLTLLPHTFDVKDMLSGKVDAMSVYAVDEPFLAGEAGRDYLLYSPRAAGIDFYSDNLFTTEAMVTERPELVRRFLAASLQGWDYAMQHREELVQLIHGEYSQHRSIDHLRFEARQMEPLLQTKLVAVGHMNAGRWRHITEIYAEMGMLKTDFDLKGFLYDPNPMPRDLTWLYGTLAAIAALLVVVILIAVRFARLSAALKRSDAERERALTEVRAGESKYRSLTESMKDVVWTLDTETMRFLYVSPSVQQLRGFTPKEVIAEPIWSAFTPAQAGRMEKDMRERVDGLLGKGDSQPKFYTDEVEQSCKDGTTVWTEMIQQYYVNAESGHVELRGVTRDITERKQTEEALQESEAKYRRVSDNSPALLYQFLLSPNGTFSFLYVGDVVVTIFGISPEDVMEDSSRLLGMVHPEDQEMFQEAIMRSADTLESFPLSFRCVKDAEVIWVEALGMPTALPDGGILWDGFLLDITERKQAEEERENVRRMLQRAEDISNQGSWEWDIVNDKWTLSANWLRIHGCSVSGISRTELMALADPDDASRIERSFQDALTGTAVYRLEHRIVRQNDKEVRHVYALGEVVRDDMGRPVKMYGTTQEITERKQLEERLRQSEKMEAIGRLAGGMAHDFNNQLGGIMNYADLLLSDADDEMLRLYYVEGIIRLCTRSGELTNQLLAFSRKGKYQVVPVDVHQTIPEVVAMLGRSSDKRIAIRQLLEANPRIVTGDPTQLQNALLNLGLNACYAMPEGGKLVFATDTVTLDGVHCRKSSFDIMPGEYVRIRVTDSGTGMDKETRSKMFEPFFTTKEQGKGTGMGLAAAFGTVVNHRGAIEVESEIGRGTTMTVYMPLATEEPQEAEAGMHVVAHAAAAEIASARILVVDDEEIVREFTAKLLRRRGYRVATCKDGAEAVEYYGESWQEIDLVILDMNMPVMNGHDAFIAMRGINADIRAMLATGYSLDDNAQAMLDEGVLSYIQKPFRINALIVQIEQALDG